MVVGVEAAIGDGARFVHRWLLNDRIGRKIGALIGRAGGCSAGVLDETGILRADRAAKLAHRIGDANDLLNGTEPCSAGVVEAACLLAFVGCIALTFDIGGADLLRVGRLYREERLFGKEGIS